MDLKNLGKSVIRKFLFLISDYILVAFTVSIPWFAFSDTHISNTHFFLYIFGSPILYIANLNLHHKLRPFENKARIWNILSWIGRILSTVCLIPALYLLYYYIANRSGNI